MTYQLPPGTPLLTHAGLMKQPPLALMTHIQTRDGAELRDVDEQFQTGRALFCWLLPNKPVGTIKKPIKKPQKRSILD